MPTNAFRADQIGSLLRPEPLLEARDRFLDGQLDAKRLEEMEDAAILQALAKQKECNIDVYVDGEFRRTGFMTNFTDSVHGFESAVASAQSWRGDKGNRPSPNIRIVKDKLRFKNRMCAKDATFLKRHAPGPFKITLPSPSNFAMLCWQAEVSAQAYPSRSDFIADMAGLIADEARMLAEEGVPYIHLDAPVYTHWADDKLVTKYRAAGIDLPRMLDDAIAADNRILDAAKKAGATTGFHLCRGNSMGRWMAEGGYDRLAERMFNEIRCDRWLLEYDSERAGTFDPLKYAPKDKMIVLGLVTTKTGALEKRDDIARRIEAAARFVPLDRLALSPQCGFASSGRGNPLSEDEQWAKLKLVTDVTQQIWSRA